jgi:phosphoesterase RecJ-like protein
MDEALSVIARTLMSSRRVLLLTHVRPDGDALGSVASTKLALEQRGVAAESLLLSKLPSKYAFVFERAGMTHTDATEGLPAIEWFRGFDAVLVLDTGTWSQLPGLDRVLPELTVPVMVIDHHRTQEPWGVARWVDTTASAAGEMVMDLVRALGATTDRRIAQALFVAIATDTGWFQFSNTTPRTMRAAAELMEAGVDTDELYQLIYQNERAPRLMLQARAMQTLKLHAEGRLATIAIRAADFKELGADVPDTENLVNIPLQVRSVELSAIFTETPTPGPIRVSLRSKGRVDVAKFAEQFGGGGHARASGLKLDGTLDEAVDRVTAALLRMLGA